MRASIDHVTIVHTPKQTLLSVAAIALVPAHMAADPAPVPAPVPVPQEDDERVDPQLPSFAVATWAEGTAADDVPVPERVPGPGPALLPDALSEYPILVRAWPSLRERHAHAGRDRLRV
jgi:hypothetical protein